ncbi:Opacity protein [Duganella sacchari]|uniref:Opacity protein n=1 Tax=Duganella sacchari TaxID=551987 RepID=A0A1M7R9Y7_9BURK|nr:porin family protein [Duganella sacchari]SHN42972.1 Opacity protein [Duganella sacchari]
MNKFLCTTLIVLAASSAAHAEDLYLGANVSPGKGKLKLSDGTGQADRDANKNSVYAGVFAGYVLSPSWALEAGYRGLGNEYTFDFPDSYRLKLKPSVAYLAARNTWQLSDDWSLYGKVGVAQGRMKVDLSDKSGSGSSSVHKTGLYLGLGVAYMVTRDVALQLELEHTDKLKQPGLSVSMDKFSLGVKVGF